MPVPSSASSYTTGLALASEKRLVPTQLHLGAMLINGEGGNPLAAAGARLLGVQLTFIEQTGSRKMAERIIGVWASFEHWAAADGGGALDIDLVAAAEAGIMAAIKRLIDSGASPDGHAAGPTGSGHQRP